jgi:predicted nucleic acid-binding protein
VRCLDTSALIEAEHSENLQAELAGETFVVPAMAAAEFLAGIAMVKSEIVRRRAQDFYDDQVKPFVFAFDESQAQTLASLIATQRKKGKILKPYDAAIAAAALELDCPIVSIDGDFDGIEGLEVHRI